MRADSASTIRRAKRWAIVIIAAIIGAALSIQPNIASQQQDNYVGDTLQCLDWLVNDFPRHQANCVSEFTPFQLEDIGHSAKPSEPVVSSSSSSFSEEEPDPCDSSSISGGAGNAGTVGGDCLEAGVIAPFLTQIFGWGNSATG